MATTITSVVKSEGHLIITLSDGVVIQRSIVYADAVTSLPPEGYEEVGVVYVDATAGTLIVNYNGETLTLGAGLGDGDMLKSIYDTDDDGTVDDAEKLEGSTKAEVQDHTPKAHTVHSEIRLTPKASSSGPEGTVFYDSDDDHVYVGTE